MHTGEEWFSLHLPQYIMLAVLFLGYMVLTFSDRLPKMSSFKDFLDAVNSAGGHIFLLTLLTLWSIKIAMQFFYHILSLPDVMTKDQAIVTAGITFVQGTLAGTFIGALLKTMSGGKANGTTLPPAPDTLTPTLTPEKDAH
jgi:hypothetical protein